jgi:hypothetical protein
LNEFFDFQEKNLHNGGGDDDDDDDDDDTNEGTQERWSHRMRERMNG